MEDLPTDVRTVLSQLFAEGQRALADDDRDTARESVTSAASVVRNKLPDGEFKRELRHGCERVVDLLDTGDEPADAEAAAEYLAAMERRLDAVE
ncbi:hypothetical protein C475_02568 [Halosimplex carlsbadense 2-9-1]|uniref:DUF8101 domain-containing protein n=1 Tax=Halosimplex carlsbadense 2-9-1 TaxID=797114 RepID=M0D1Z0_9EURY|nr:hypothetical protein [Halosimplex carlsbadense]ELZ29496.1 hypothetical protein C475_02568 [Halosimplex carlsbadense 2-9-1]